jgi:hypothetical protein
VLGGAHRPEPGKTGPGAQTDRDGRDYRDGGEAGGFSDRFWNEQRPPHWG